MKSRTNQLSVKSFSNQYPGILSVDESREIHVIREDQPNAESRDSTPTLRQ